VTEHSSELDLHSGDPAYVIAIGASAGGLEALDRFFSAMPPRQDLAFVVIQHLPADHKSLMSELLRRHTTMPVAEAQQGSALEGGHVYLIPPGMTMTLDENMFRLVKRPARGLSFPIDDFFNSLAEHWGLRAIGIVLSGTGTDGSRGMQTLQAAGAWTFVQDPTSAKFDGMPLASLNALKVDRVLTPEALAAEVDACTRTGELEPSPADGAEPGDDEFDELLRRLQARSGLDFSGYKSPMVMRRIHRRMQAREVEHLADYLAIVDKHVDELDMLRRDLLISVTRFYRDDRAFDSLAREVIAPLARTGEVGGDGGAAPAAPAPTGDDVQELPPSAPRPLRVWVAGCATGEEAYTIAMLVAQALEAAGRPLDFKLFATDAEPRALDVASRGQYPERIEADVPPALLKRWFRKRNQCYEIVPELRQRVTFARHDLLSDAPFSQVDLVTCRNLLIYIKPAMQARILRRLQFSLRPGGVLMLGCSESLPPEILADFDAIDARNKIYQVVHRPALHGTDMPAPQQVPAREALAATTAQRLGGPALPGVDLALELLLRQYAPTAFLLGPDRRVVHVFGRANRWLRFVPGSASLDIGSLLPDTLSAVTSVLLQMAARNDTPQRSAILTVENDEGALENLRVAVWPIGRAGAERHMLLCLEPATASGAPAAAAAAGDERGVPAATSADDLHALIRTQVRELEAELAGTRLNLQSTIQDLGAMNEEIQASNEELTASNEELQSTNEELQSVNEELHAVNAEYQAKIRELNAANADLALLSVAMQQPVLFVDEQLTLLRFTPEVKQLFRVRESDVGRPLPDLVHRLDYPELHQDLQRAMAAGITIAREALADDGRSFLCRAVPYSASGGMRRAVFTAIDVSELKDARKLQQVIDALPQSIAVIDPDGRIELVNRAWHEFAAFNGDSQLHRCGPGANYFGHCDASPQDEYAQRAREGIAGVIEGRLDGFSMEYPVHAEHEQRWLHMQAARLGGEGSGVVVSHINVTGWRRAAPGLAEPASHAAPAAASGVPVADVAP
jgi:two-component system CheB/CheR fusion protein